MKALKLYTAVSTLVLAGSIALAAPQPVRAEPATHFSVHAEQTSSPIVQSNVLFASESAAGPGQVATIQQLIVQTGVNVNMNALLWNFPTDQLDPGAIFGDLSFLNGTPLAPLMDPSDPPHLLQAPEPSMIEQFIQQSGMNFNVSTRIWDTHSQTDFPAFDEVDQSNELTAIQKATAFKAILHLDQTVLQTDFNFNSTGLFSKPPTGNPTPSLLFHDFDFLQTIPPMELTDPDPEPKDPLVPFSLPGNPDEPTLLVSQTIIQTGVNFNLNILDILSDDPAPASADEFGKFFPLVTQSNVLIADQEASVVPERATLGLLGIGLSGLAAALRQRSLGGTGCEERFPRA
jgi:hypothetical protein